jgi:hypothetical protein
MFEANPLVTGGRMRPGAGDKPADCPRVQQTTQDEQLCLRCAEAPAVYLGRPHPGVGWCSPCYVALINAPELAATA